MIDSKPTITISCRLEVDLAEKLKGRALLAGGTPSSILRDVIALTLNYPLEELTELVKQHEKMEEMIDKLEEIIGDRKKHLEALKEELTDWQKVLARYQLGEAGFDPTASTG